MENKRTANFTMEEQQLLVALVEKYRNIVECKKSGVITWKQKEAGWKKIENEFNSRSSSSAFKSSKILKVKYANMKKKTKEKFAHNKQNMLKTGGGTSKMQEYTDIDLTIKSIVGAQLDGLNNNYDSDSFTQSK